MYMYVYDCTNQKCTCTCTYNDKFPYVQVHYIIMHKSILSTCNMHTILMRHNCSQLGHNLRLMIKPYKQQT